MYQRLNNRAKATNRACDEIIARVHSSDSRLLKARRRCTSTSFFWMSSMSVGDHVRITSVPGKPLGRITKSFAKMADDRSARAGDHYVYDVWVEAQQKEYHGLRASDLSKPRGE